jgi:hypothetical protein
MHFVALVLILWDSVATSMIPKIPEHAIRHYEIPVLEGNRQVIEHFVSVPIA